MHKRVQWVEMHLRSDQSDTRLRRPLVAHFANYENTADLIELLI